MQFTLPITAQYGGKSLSDAQALALAVIFHISLAFAALLAAQMPKAEIEPAHPIEVRLIQAERPVQTPPPPLPTPPKPQPVQKQPVKPLPTPAPMAPLTAPVAPPADPVAPVQESAPVPFLEAKFDAAYLNNPKPAYPVAARRRGETGTVHLRVHVTEAGHAAEVELKTSSGSAILDRAAMETVAKWKFVPAKKGTLPVDSWVIVPIKFSLNDE